MIDYEKLIAISYLLLTLAVLSFALGYDIGKYVERRRQEKVVVK